MDTQDAQAGETKPETRRLLKASEYFLARRNFVDCRNYAIRAQQCERNHPGPAQLLAIAAVLSAPNVSKTLPDYYSILSIARFESDRIRIKSSYRTLTSNLNPNKNPYPFASDAYELVLKAWSVLSNPGEKIRYDEELKMEGCTSRSDGSTFWTMCPYCYYVYEYEKVFAGCCLRCHNGKCRRAFDAVAISGPPPPEEVAQKGRYPCPGFVPLGLSKNNRYGGQRKRGKSWSPFTPTVAQKGSANCNNVVIDISDSDDEMVEPETKCQDDGNSEKMKFEGENSGDGSVDNGGTVKSENVDAERVKMECEDNKGPVENGKEVRMRRKKMAARTSKKMMGRGLRVDRNETDQVLGVEEGDSKIEGNNGQEDIGEGIDSGTKGVEFFAGDNDIFVGLQCDFDLANG